ncbi:Lyso-PAF_acetyltransferase / Lysophosphatidylcholine acyltransferase [Hexamita inflata]|uniref:Lyso-PAF acetyltransferase / Lysophosphatidylcholine acyltransferase n=1 Tax=Hexamita inflata TaxID=28002 RepID=A0AA86QPT5_9EUKA|nr:Lyso-PAF acetyltransferase / Lysophosphatidylcholine acyltransferase [Hexamita inflata]CAI9970498.1 Lyso-PAF acetyltransferase / Lysophosphatidylcholine acyltransferase [Hexamita inflata]
MLDILIGAGHGMNSCISIASVGDTVFGNTLKVSRSVYSQADHGHEKLRSRLENPGYPPLAVFAGGTPTNPNILPRFRTGIFYYKPSIQIVTIKYFTYSNIYQTNMSWVKHVFNILTCPFVIAKIKYHPEIQSAKPLEQPQDFANRVGKLIAEKIEGEYTKYNFKDCLWFNGHDEYISQLSDEFKRDHHWRGNNIEWQEKCKLHNLDPQYSWPKDMFPELK